MVANLKNHDSWDDGVGGSPSALVPTHRRNQTTVPVPNAVGVFGRPSFQNAILAYSKYAEVHQGLNFQIFVSNLMT